ncbi:hypothetical protein BJX68DRAFT_204053 [Aspergillus pseudodeflectus]|uniref:Uncharacterized protein n=1 Tax=Aspergillus pseudodeflectus TaxID=176178 RepID=A0ABR4KVB5_9EURO
MSCTLARLLTESGEEWRVWLGLDGRCLLSQMSHPDSWRAMQPWAVPVDRRSIRTSVYLDDATIYDLQYLRPFALRRLLLARSVVAATSGIIMICAQNPC